MPLPEGGKIPWPPAEHEAVYRRYKEHAAWYSGDPNQLVDFYAYMTRKPGGLEVFPSQHSLWRTNFDRFWARGAYAPWRRQLLHIPLPADIATTSADLLFSEPVAVTIEEAAARPGDFGAKGVQDRLDELLESIGIRSLLVEAAETSAAFGGVFLRVVWDQEMEPEHPLLCRVDADAAVPEFWYGRLQAVTFWDQIRPPEGQQGVWRQLERHEPGMIFHGLYKGDGEFLGERQPLGLAPGLYGPLDDQIGTGIDQLTAIYIPNMRPNRLGRDQNLGRSDYDGVEALFDSLDETWTSWMRDLRLARARLLIASEYLDAQGPGKGAVADLDQEVFEKIEMGRNDPPITPSQFAIRSQQHMETATALVERIVSAAGYAAATFGIQEQQRGVTATEIISRERRSYVTRDKKINYWQRPLEEILETLLAIDAAHFQEHEVYRPKVEFAPAISTDPAQMAATVATLKQAQAASTETIVRMVHGEDWTEEEVLAEVVKIHAENPVPVPSIRTQPQLSPAQQQLQTAGSVITGTHEALPRGSTQGSDNGSSAEGGAYG